MAASGPKVSRSLASRRMARTRWGTRRVLLTRASLFAGDAVLLHHAVEVVAIDAREARGFGHVVLCALEQVEHVALLEGVDGGGATGANELGLPHAQAARRKAGKSLGLT